MKIAILKKYHSNLGTVVEAQSEKNADWDILEGRK